MWNMRVTVIGIVTGALGTISKGLKKGGWKSLKSEDE